MTLATPEYLQTKTYVAERDRFVNQHGAPIQEGVVANTDYPTPLKVTQRGAGANMSVDVASGPGWVKGDASARSGLYHVHNQGVVNVPVAANASGSPRIDQIVLHIYDTVDIAGSGTDTPALEIVQGTATGGATLDNRSGAAALPANAIRLADVLVANGAASILDASIRDRRPWAHGAYFVSNQIAGADYSISSTTFAELDATNLKKRIECSGRPLKVRFAADQYLGSAANQAGIFRPTVDGASAVGQTEGYTTSGGSAASGYGAISAEWTIVPSAGSHLIAIQAKTNIAGTTTVQRGTDYGVYFEIEELPKVSATND